MAPMAPKFTNFLPSQEEKQLEVSISGDTPATAKNKYVLTIISYRGLEKG